MKTKYDSMCVHLAEKMCFGVVSYLNVHQALSVMGLNTLLCLKNDDGLIKTFLVELFGTDEI